MDPDPDADTDAQRPQRPLAPLYSLYLAVLASVGLNAVLAMRGHSIQAEAGLFAVLAALFSVFVRLHIRSVRGQGRPVAPVLDNPRLLFAITTLWALADLTFARTVLAHTIP